MSVSREAVLQALKDAESQQRKAVWKACMGLQLLSRMQRSSKIRFRVQQSFIDRLGIRRNTLFESFVSIPAENKALAQSIWKQTDEIRDLQVSLQNAKRKLAVIRNALYYMHKEEDDGK